ncbi:hypothetical protein LDENG_00002990 [Lucifuga dentata]|nr:hypothetical protein LDENG_00002990 [Lucifuga dentata]
MQMFWVLRASAQGNTAGTWETVLNVSASSLSGNEDVSEDKTQTQATPLRRNRAYQWGKMDTRTANQSQPPCQPWTSQNIWSAASPQGLPCHPLPSS